MNILSCDVVPYDYFKLSKENRKEIMVRIIENILEEIDENKIGINPMLIFLRILDNTIKELVQEELYECAQFYLDIKTFINTPNE